MKTVITQTSEKIRKLFMKQSKNRHAALKLHCSDKPKIFLYESVLHFTRTRIFIHLSEIWIFFVHILLLKRLMPPNIIRFIKSRRII